MPIAGKPVRFGDQGFSAPGQLHRTGMALVSRVCLGGRLDPNSTCRAFGRRGEENDVDGVGFTNSRFRYVRGSGPRNGRGLHHLAGNNVTAPDVWAGSLSSMTLFAREVALVLSVPCMKILCHLEAFFCLVCAPNP